jgi:hypothetical protein
MGLGVQLRTALALLLGLILTACGSNPAQDTITVDEFLSKIDELDGQTVSVVGYLGECQGRSCRLYRNETESADVDRAMSAIRNAIDQGSTDTSGFPFPDHPAVSIGTGPEDTFVSFDLLAYFYQRSSVVIEGKASNMCISQNVVCFDRASDLKPRSIRWTPPPGE